MSKEDQEIDAHLFQDAFHSWLGVHGVTIGENVGNKFVCTIDLNVLKPAIMQLALAREEAAKIDAVRLVRACMDNLSNGEDDTRFKYAYDITATLIEKFHNPNIPNRMAEILPPEEQSDARE